MTLTCATEWSSKWFVIFVFLNAYLAACMAGAMEAITSTWDHNIASLKQWWLIVDWIPGRNLQWDSNANHF